MIATIEYVEKKFHEFNELIFKGSLQPITIRLSNARTFLGQLRFTRKRNFFGSWQYSDFVLVVSKRKDMGESLLEDTIIHEMIHYYILSNKIQDSSAHGKVFRRLQNDINTRFGRNICISHRCDKDENLIEAVPRAHYVCISRFSDGKTGVTVAAKSRLFELWDRIPAFPGVVECKWYLSMDPFFNPFPRSLKVKIYCVSNEKLEPVLAKARVLLRDGEVIRVK